MRRLLVYSVQCIVVFYKENEGRFKCYITTMRRDSVNELYIKYFSTYLTPTPEKVTSYPKHKAFYVTSSRTYFPP
jgi:hypothetical protein